VARLGRPHAVVADLLGVPGRLPGATEIPSDASVHLHGPDLSQPPSGLPAPRRWPAGVASVLARWAALVAKEALELRGDLVAGRDRLGLRSVQRDLELADELGVLGAVADHLVDPLAGDGGGGLQLGAVELEAGERGE